MLVESLFVDDFVGGAADNNDFVGGAADDNEAFEIYHKARQVMKVAGFDLRKWNTNSPTLKTKIEGCNELW